MVERKYYCASENGIQNIKEPSDTLEIIHQYLIVFEVK